MDVIGFSFTVVKTKPSSCGLSWANALRLIRPKAARRIVFFHYYVVFINIYATDRAKMLMRMPGIPDKAFAQAEIVAPVVITSSMSRICLFFKLSG